MTDHRRLGRALRVAVLRERARRAALQVANDAVGRSAALVDHASARVTQPAEQEQAGADVVRSAAISQLRAAAVRSAQMTHAGTILHRQAVSAQWDAARARAERLGERHDQARAIESYEATVNAQRESDDGWHATRARP